MKRVFISCRGCDSRAIGFLYEDLTYHGVAVWDYQRFDEGIAAGETIGRELYRRIDEADLMIAVVSAASCAPDSEWTRREVKHALATDTVIVPMSLPDAPPSAEWTGPYGELKDLEKASARVRPTDFAERSHFVAVLLKRFGIRYEPRDDAHERLPVIRRFREEVDRLSPSWSVYTRLVARLGRFTRCYREARFEEGLSILRSFEAVAEDDLCGRSVEYVTVCRGVCELHLRRFEQAIAAFHLVLERGRPESASSAFADAQCGMGYALHMLGRHEDALRHLRAGHAALLERDEDIDASTVTNLAASLVRLRRGDEATSWLRQLDAASLLPDDRVRVGIVRAQACLLAGDAETARAILVRLPRLGGVAEVSLCVRLAEALVECDAIEQAMAVAAEGARRTDHEDLRELHAQLLVRYGGDVEGALRIYERLLETHPTRERLAVAAAWLNDSGRHADARRLCERVVAPGLGGIVSPSDYYYTGLALYLLGPPMRPAADLLFRFSDGFGCGYEEATGLP